MKYYYLISRIYISNKCHIINRNLLDVTWKRLSEDRRRLRIHEMKQIKNKEIYNKILSNMIRN
jgi:hypothetical protein